jgi:hypothetical protein
MPEEKKRLTVEEDMAEARKRAIKHGGPQHVSLICKAYGIASVAEAQEMAKDPQETPEMRRKAREALRLIDAKPQPVSAKRNWKRAVY